MALGFVLLRGIPALFDGAFGSSADEGGIGATPYFAAIYTFVNIHHYFMDYVICRRENPTTRYLMTS